MSAPLVVNTVDGMCWTRREATRDGDALYALADVVDCPDMVMATYAELAEHGIAGVADVLPVPVSLFRERARREREPGRRMAWRILAREYEDPHDSDLHHDYALGRDLPEIGGTSC